MERPPNADLGIDARGPRGGLRRLLTGMAGPASIRPEQSPGALGADPADAVGLVGPECATAVLASATWSLHLDCGHGSILLDNEQRGKSGPAGAIPAAGLHEVVLELARTARVAQLAQRLRLDLADPLAGQ